MAIEAVTTILVTTDSKWTAIESDIYGEMLTIVQSDDGNVGFTGTDEAIHAMLERIGFALIAKDSRKSART